jgi:5,10-methylenetetrahydrofolate reductase
LDISARQLERYLRAHPQNIPTDELVKMMGLLGEVYAERGNGDIAQRVTTSLHFVRDAAGRFIHIATDNTFEPNDEIKQTLAMLDSGIVSVADVARDLNIPDATDVQGN